LLEVVEGLFCFLAGSSLVAGVLTLDCISYIGGGVCSSLALRFLPGSGATFFSRFMIGLTWQYDYKHID